MMSGLMVDLWDAGNEAEEQAGDYENDRVGNLHFAGEGGEDDDEEKEEEKDEFDGVDAVACMYDPFRDKIH